MKSLEPGDRLDHYLIQEEVASTAMSTIFRGLDQETGQPVAIKIPQMMAESDPVFFDRFKREIEIGKSLRHPAIAQVFGEEEHSRLYMVTEWVEGRRLREILAAEGKLPFERAAALTLQICGALEYIHSRGVVHRDLKPENILVDAGDRIKLIDFGIAAQTGARRLTFGKFSEVMGSPDYISPEQVKGKRGDLRCDLYSLGVILYEMTTGAVPFRGATLLALMNDRVTNHPVPPREANPEITPQLQEILYRALEREPAHRYPSAQQFAWDLSHQDQVSIEDRGEIATWKSDHAPRKRPWLSYAMAVLIPMVVLGLLLFAARRG